MHSLTTGNGYTPILDADLDMAFVSKVRRMETGLCGKVVDIPKDLVEVINAELHDRDSFCEEMTLCGGSD